MKKKLLVLLVGVVLLLGFVVTFAKDPNDPIPMKDPNDPIPTLSKIVPMGDPNDPIPKN